MKREEQVRRALRLIKPAADRRKDCKSHIQETLGLYGFDGTTHAKLNELPPKQRKQAATKFRAALKRVISTSHPFQGTSMFGSVDEERSELLSLTSKFIGRCDQIISTSLGPPKRNSDKQRWAAREAVYLLFQYHPDCRKFSDVSTEVASKLAAVLYGDPAADLRSYVRQCKKPGSK
jgi:hypothetical protein